MQNKNNFFFALFNFTKFLKPSFKKKFNIYFLLIILSSFGEFISLGSIVPILYFFIGQENLSLSSFMIIGNIKSSFFNNINFLLLIFISAIVLSSFFRLLMIRFNIFFSQQMTSSFATKIFENYITQNYINISKLHSNKLISGITEKLEIFSHIIFNVMNLISSSLITIAIVLALFLTGNFLIIFNTFFWIIMIYVILSKILKKKLFYISKEINNLQNFRIKAIQNSLGNLKNIILDNDQKIYSNFFNNLDYHYRKYQAKIAFISSMPRILVEMAGIVIIISICLYIRNFTSIDNAYFLIQISVIVYASQKILPLLQQIYIAWSTVSGNKDTIDEIYSSLKNNNNEISKNQKKIFFKELKFSKIFFKYNSNQSNIINNFNYKISRGDKIGIIGKSGKGKSTLLDISMGLLLPTNGSIYFNNIKIDNKNINILRKNCSHVPQNFFMINDTIKKNIIFNLDQKDFNIKKFDKVIEICELKDFIKNLKDKENSIIGDSGLSISGGQRQRIAIARALYKEKDILIFDEATNSLDPETEFKILNNIFKQYKNLTIIAVTHNQNILKNFTKIINLNEK